MPPGYACGYVAYLVKDHDVGWRVEAGDVSRKVQDLFNGRTAHLNALKAERRKEPLVHRAHERVVVER